MSTRRPLTSLPRDLARRGLNSPSYQALYRWAVSALLPVEQTSNGRWMYAAEDLPAIEAAVIRLRPEAAPAQQNAA